MSNIKDLIKRNRSKTALLTAVFLITIGVTLALTATAVINGFEQQLNNPDIALEETWRIEGALQWWRTTNATIFQPLTPILTTLSIGILVTTRKSIMPQQNRVQDVFTERLLQASKESLGRK
jgi:hypothetical protein